MPQSLSNILIHLVFGTKLRHPYINDEVQKELYDYMTGIAKAYHVFVHEIGGIEDHVHILISLPRVLTVSKLVEELKKGSSKWIKTKGMQYKKFTWQRGYAAFSIGQSGYEGLRQYIQKQKDHHKKVSFQDEYRSFLKKYKINFDEAYVWD
jgi:putative transposase